MTFRAKIWAISVLFCLLFWAGTAAVLARECGVASWYGAESGNVTANGQRFDGKSLTVAHRTLPFGTKLRVTLDGKSVVVRVNDRGPFKKGRKLDLAEAAAKRIGLKHRGVATVCWEILR